MFEKIEKNIVYFAETNFRNEKKRFGIKRHDRTKHMYIIGKTGMGKTTLLENMAVQDILNNEGVGIVDPHGEFAEKMLHFIPEHRIDDVLYFAPHDIEWPIAFNVMEKVDPTQRHLVAAGLLGVFKKIWPDVWSPRMEYILNNCILALLEYPDSTLLGINRMLSDKAFREEVVSKITDPVVKAFWVDEFAKYPDRFMTEAGAAIQNKVGQFISNPLIRNIIGQEKSAFDIRDLMDQKKIFIMNLSKGRIGEENSRLIGAMLITKIYLAAMSRVDAPEHERPDFYLYVDEFQNFATESFKDILSEARKYHLNLTLAHQYIAQMDEKVRDAVFGNVGTLITFRVGAADAEFLEKEYTPEFSVQDLVNLGFSNIYLRLMIDGVASRAFSANTLPPIIRTIERSNADKIIELSREKYATARQEVEEEIAQWHAPAAVEKSSFDGVPPGASRSIPHPGEIRHQIYEAMCSVCGKKTFVPFKPDGKRPVFCKAHRKGAMETRRIPSLKEGQFILKSDSQKTISLNELENKTFEEKKLRPAPKIDELREVLNEVLAKPKNDSPAKKGIINPGEKIKFEQ
ncbi:MAG: CxxC-x17-CxxC domain-containing protein [Patescibacteria group bacterium]